MQSEAETPRVRNDAMIREVVRHIQIMPHRWYQRAWAMLPGDPGERYMPESFRQLLDEFEAKGGTCGTTFCVAGWAARLAGYVDERGRPTPKAREWVTASYLAGYMPGEEKDDELWINEENGQVNDDDVWQKWGAEVLGLPDWKASRIFDGDFAQTVPELIEKLSAELDMTFDDPDPHDIDSAQTPTG
jgi:hypothetical protein